VPEMPAGAARILVVFALDADGSLTVTASEETTGVSQTVDVVPSYGLTEAEVLEMLKSSVLNARQDVENRMIEEARLELERVCDACAAALASDGQSLDVDSSSAHEKALLNARTVVAECNNKDVLGSEMASLEAVFQALSERRVNNALKKAIVGTSVTED